MIDIYVRPLLTIYEMASPVSNSREAIFPHVPLNHFTTGTFSALENEYGREDAETARDMSGAETIEKSTLAPETSSSCVRYVLSATFPSIRIDPI